jgi:hypothetical protein
MPAARVSAAGAQLVAEDDRPVGQYRVAFERQLAQRLALDDPCVGGDAGGTVVTAIGEVMLSGFMIS